MKDKELVSINISSNEEAGNGSVQLYSKEQTELARKKLDSLGFSKANNIVIESANKKLSISNSYNQQSIKRAYFSGLDIFSDFESAAVTGSKFINCNFLNIPYLRNSNFEFCDFFNCTFSENSQKTLEDNKKIVLDSISFNGSYFKKTDFTNIDITHSTFTNALFEDCTFKNIVIKSSTFENSKFIDCAFHNSDLSNLNMDYVDFENIKKMEEVVLPLSQISYMFGCLDYLINTSTDIYINKKDSNIKIVDILDDLLCYYTGIKEFFPVTNILLAQNRFEEARKTLMQGIFHLINNKEYDFRMFKYLFKLNSKHNLLTKAEKDSLYNGIMSIFENNLDNQYHAKLSSHLGEIQSYLYTVNNSISMTLKTNIDINETHRIANIIDIFNDIENLLDCNISFKISHNSQAVIDLVITIGNKVLISLGTGVIIHKILPKIGRCIFKIFSAMKSRNQKVENNDSEQRERQKEKELFKTLQITVIEVEEKNQSLAKIQEKNNTLKNENLALKRENNFLKRENKANEELIKKLIEKISNQSSITHISNCYIDNRKVAIEEIGA